MLSNCFLHQSCLTFVYFPPMLNYTEMNIILCMCSIVLDCCPSRDYRTVATESNDIHFRYVLHNINKLHFRKFILLLTILQVKPHLKMCSLCTVVSFPPLLPPFFPFFFFIPLLIHTNLMCKRNLLFFL